jgi:hypothetical protein
MLDFIGTVVTATLMVFAVNAVIVFMDISRFAKLALALAIGLWIGLSAAAGAAGMIAISKTSRSSEFLLLCRFSRRRSQRVGPPCAAQC